MLVVGQVYGVSRGPLRSCYTKIMQQDSNEEWQQPAQSASNGVYQQPQDAKDYADDQSAEDVADYEAPEDDSAVLRWQAPEYISHDRDKLWYVVFAVVTLMLMALSIFLIRSITFTILIPVMAAALFVYIRRAPQQISYTVSRTGVHVNDKIYTYPMFKAFSINSVGGSHSAILIPRKRFQMALIAYFPEEVGEPLVDMLAARLPMQTYTPDVLDKLLIKLHL